MATIQRLTAALLVTICCIAIQAPAASATTGATPDTSDVISKAAATLDQTSRADNVSAGAALATTDDAVGKAVAATVTPATTTANVEEDILFDTFSSLCRNTSRANRGDKCGSVIPAACAALHNKTEVLKYEARMAGEIYVPNVAHDVLLGLDPASRARTRACTLTLIDKRLCRKVSIKKASSFDKKRGQLVSEAPKLLVQLCGDTYYVDTNECDAYDKKCLRAFKKGKTSIQLSTLSKETTEVKVLRNPTTYTETVRGWTTHTTFDCCTKADRCLCELKKRLGNNTNIRIPCLEKKGLQACK